jgi:hypothetical protein
MSERDIVDELMDADFGWSGDAMCVSQEVAERGATEIKRLRASAQSAGSQASEVTQSAPVCDSSLPSGESNPVVTRDCSGTDTKDIIEQCAQVAVAMTQKWGDPNGNDYQQGAQDHGIRIIHQIRALKSASLAEPESRRTAPGPLTVWYGPMPESNGKSNFTAILHKGDLVEGHTIARSEYPDRVRYEADRVRYLIGDLPEYPDILSYDADKHSGYVYPAPSSAGTVEPDPQQLRAADEWCGDHGDMLWWRIGADGKPTEVPWVGSPLSCGYTVEAHTTTRIISQMNQDHDPEPRIERIDVGGWVEDYFTHFSEIPRLALPGNERATSQPDTGDQP